MADVLQKLKGELEEQRAALADAKRAVQHLEVAIAAIERDEAELKKQKESQRPVSKRGYLSRAILDAIGVGIGTASTIVSHLSRQGIETTQPSVSNAIGRLQRSGQISWDLKSRRWVLTAHSGALDEGSANKVSAPDGSPGPESGGSLLLSSNRL